MEEKGGRRSEGHIGALCRNSALGRSRKLGGQSFCVLDFDVAEAAMKLGVRGLQWEQRQSHRPAGLFTEWEVERSGRERSLKASFHLELGGESRAAEGVI